MDRYDIDYASELNPDQLAAVTAPFDRPALVLAGAGSGKTRTLTYRVAWLLSECGLYPREILLLTFTNKAANQMLERIRTLTGHSPSDFWGGTFHSVGNRFLRIEGRAIGIEPDFTIIDTEDAEKALKRVVEKEFPNFFSHKDNPRAKLLREIISYARNTRLPLAEAMADRFSWLETPCGQIEEIAELYDAAKREQNFCDFDDLLTLWHKILEECPEVLKKYTDRFQNILVDEYQDTNKIQCDILDLLASRGNISAVGDDAQCIYTWRGAEIDNILRFRDRYPAAGIYKIERNYRSSPQILNFANEILGDMPTDEEYRKILVPAREGISKPVVIRALDAAAQGRVVADFINNIAGGGRYSYSDIAVLYRSHFQAMDLQLQLQYKRVPFMMTSGVKFFEQAHIKDVISQIKFASNPRDFVSFARFLKFLPKIGAKTAEKIFRNASEIAAERGVSAASILSDKAVMAKVPAAARELFEAMASDVAHIAEMLARASKKPAAQAPAAVEAEQTDFYSSMSARPHSSEPKKAEPFTEEDCAPKDIVKFACVGWYMEAMKTAYEDWNERAEDFDSLCEYASRYKDFGDFIANVTLEMSEVEGAQTPEDAEAAANTDRVRLMTVHQAKGLEFPVVFIIGAADGLFPIQRSIDDGDVDEERRLFYVASTRAMDHLIITYPRISASGGNFEQRQASRFLEAVDPNLYTLDY